MSVLPINYAAVATGAYGALPWNVYPAGLVQQQQQNGSGPNTTNSGGGNGQPPPRRPGTPNGSVTPGPPEAPAYQQVFPTAYFDPARGALLRLPAAPPAAGQAAPATAAAAAAAPPGVRLLPPTAAAAVAAAAANNPLLMGNGLNSLNLPQNNSLGYGSGGTGGSSGPLGGSPAATGFNSGARRDSFDRAPAFSPSLDKNKAVAAAAAAAAAGLPAAWPYTPLGLGSGALTPPPGSLASGINLLHTRLNVADRGGGGSSGFQPRNNGSLGGLFNSNSLFGGGGGALAKNRHNSIDSKQINRSKLLEDFR